MSRTPGKCRLAPRKGKPARFDGGHVLFIAGPGLARKRHWTKAVTQQKSASAKEVGSGGRDRVGAVTVAAVGSRACSDPGPHSSLVSWGYYDLVTDEEAKAQSR